MRLAWLVWGLAAAFYFSDYLARVAPTVMHLAGLPVPKEMDGRVLTEILTQERALTPIEYSETEGWQAGEIELSAQDQADMLDKLRGLGYVE